MEVVKSNLCPLPPPLGLVFEDGGTDAPLLPEPPLPTQLDLCAAWLLETLAAAAEPLSPGRSAPP